MAVKLGNGNYSCSICGKEYTNPALADACRDSHQYLYIPMSKTELNRLMQAIILDDVTLVPNHLIETLKKYAKGFQGGA